MKKECIFCNIAKGDTPADILFQNETLVVFRDIHPQAPVHLLIVPRKHIRSINDMEEADRSIVSEMLFAAKMMAKKTSIAESGYRLFF